MQDFDAIVIGSGSGGLTAALALARAGRSVVVFEQHYLPGGYSQSFTLQGFRFSPGIHYIGELQPGGALRGSTRGSASPTTSSSSKSIRTVTNMWSSATSVSTFPRAWRTSGIV